MAAGVAPPFVLRLVQHAAEALEFRFGEESLPPALPVQLHVAAGIGAFCQDAPVLRLGEDLRQGDDRVVRLHRRRGQALVQSGDVPAPDGADAQFAQARHEVPVDRRAANPQGRRLAVHGHVLVHVPGGHVRQLGSGGPP